MSWKTWIGAVAFALLCPLVAGCGDGFGCTEIGCDDAVQVRFPSQVDGTYDLTVEVGDTSWTTACPGHTYNETALLTCDAQGFVLSKPPGDPWDGLRADVQVLEVGFGVSQPGGGFSGVGHATLRERYRPNGDGCPPVCVARETSVEFDP